MQEVVDPFADVPRQPAGTEPQPDIGFRRHRHGVVAHGCLGRRVVEDVVVHSGVGQGHRRVDIDGPDAHAHVRGRSGTLGGGHGGGHAQQNGGAEGAQTGSNENRGHRWHFCLSARPSLRRMPVYPKRSQLAVQVRALDAEGFGGLADTPVMLLEHVRDVFTFKTRPGLS